MYILSCREKIKSAWKKKILIFHYLLIALSSYSIQANFNNRYCSKFTSFFHCMEIIAILSPGNIHWTWMSDWPPLLIKTMRVCIHYLIHSIRNLLKKKPRTTIFTYMLARIIIRLREIIHSFCMIMKSKFFKLIYLDERQKR
jgi:hypothetical protein